MSAGRLTALAAHPAASARHQESVVEFIARVGCASTPGVAARFGMTTYAAYRVLSALERDGKVLKLAADRVGSDGISCDWILSPGRGAAP